MNNVISFFRPGPMPRHRLPRGAILNPALKRRAAEIISQYRADEDSLENRRAMKDALRESGIGPGEDLRHLLHDAGFKTLHTAREEESTAEPQERSWAGIRDLGIPKGLPAFIHRFLERWRTGDASAGETTEFVDEVRRMSTPPRGLFINLLA